MKATVEFQLPEEQEDYEIFMNASKNLYALDEIDQFLRAKLKYDELSEDKYACYTEIREKLWKLRNETD